MVYDAPGRGPAPHPVDHFPFPEYPLQQGRRCVQAESQGRNGDGKARFPMQPSGRGNQEGGQQGYDDNQGRVMETHGSGSDALRI